MEMTPIPITQFVQLETLAYVKNVVLTQLAPNVFHQNIWIILEIVSILELLGISKINIQSMINFEGNALQLVRPVRA